MGRAHHLKQTLPENLKAFPDPDIEFVVVNYSSPDDLMEWLPGIASKDSRIKIIMVPGRKFYRAAHAKNIAGKSATGRILLYVDADIFVSEQLLQVVKEGFHPDRTGRIARVEDWENLNYWGMIAIAKEDFVNMGGYNEAMGDRWGMEDCELRHRAVTLGGFPLFILDPSLLKGIKHSWEEGNYYKVKDKKEGYSINSRLGQMSIANRSLVANIGATGWGINEPEKD